MKLYHGKYIIPGLVVFLIVVAVLIWRPWGLFGTELRT